VQRTISRLVIAAAMTLSLTTLAATPAYAAAPTGGLLGGLVTGVVTGVVGTVTGAVAPVTGAVAPAQAATSTGGLLGLPSFSSSSGVLLGANNWSCRPTAAHPRPVVLVHGTFANMTTWQSLAPQLSNAGYCVFAFNYGCQVVNNTVCGTGLIEDSAQQLSDFVDQVLAATNASQVDIVGHSQGGMMPRYYMKFLGGAAKVHRLVGLAPSNHGTNVNGLESLVALVNGATAVCDACDEQLIGSAFLAKLNAGGDTLPRVRYTVVESRFDEVVTPFQGAFLSGPAVTNILLQNACPLDLTGHVSIVLDPNAQGWVFNALDSRVPPPGCTIFALAA
jgi:triacylglycerol esterase/lipase EstA (alpha/beta hydrolase family)